MRYPPGMVEGKNRWIVVGCLWAAQACAGASEVPALDLKFGDFFVSPMGPRGPQMTARLLAAHGQRVRITGYMVVDEEQPRGHFFLSPRPISMSEHADGEAHDLPASAVWVWMPPAHRGETVLPTPGLMRLTGTLQVGRHEMDDGRITWVRLMLESP